MERSYSNNQNSDNFSKQIPELNIQEIDRKYSNKHKNSNNFQNNKIYCDENSIDQIYLNNNIIENFNINDGNYANEQNSDFNENYKYNRRISKSSEKRKVSNKLFNFNSSGNSEKRKNFYTSNSNNKNTINLSKDIKDFYCNQSDIISEEGFSEFNENFSDCPRSGKTQTSNQFEKEIKNINLNFLPENNNDKYNKYFDSNVDNKNDNNNNNKIKNDFILNFDPNDKNLNYAMKRNQTVQIIKEGILQKKSPWFHYNTRKIVLDSTPRIEYIDPVLNKIKVIFNYLNI